MKFNWNFQSGRGKGGEGLEKLFSVGEIWILSGTTYTTKHRCAGFAE